MVTTGSDMNQTESTSQDSTENVEDLTKSPLFQKISIAITLLVLVIFLGIQFWSDSGTGTIDPMLQSRLDLTRSALAATENLEPIEADQAWEELFQADSQNRSNAMNRAINRLLRVDSLASKATNASLDEDEKKAARSQLPNAISAARMAIEDFQKTSDELVLSIWFNARINLHEASLLPGSMTKSLRREVYQTLSKELSGKAGDEPLSRILGGVLIQVIELLEDPIDGLPDELVQDASRAVNELSSRHADNLYFALRAARLGISVESVQATEAVMRASELAEAIEPSIRRETEPIGVTPEQLVAQIIAAIESGNWSEADNRMLLWFNVLNSTEIVKTDRRRANPHPLDILNFDSLRKLSAEVVTQSPIDPFTSELIFEEGSFLESEPLTAMAVVDAELNLIPDLVTLDVTNHLKLWIGDGVGGLQAESILELPISCEGIIAADLFLVDSSNPARLKASQEASSEGEADYSAASRHDTLLNLIAYGAEGVQLIQVDGREGTPEEERLKLVENETGLESLKDVLCVVAGDLEADGDLDLIFSTQQEGIRLFVNRGNRTFFELTNATGDFGSDDPASDLAIVDLDRDLDLDVVTVHSGSGKVGIIENLLHLQFRGRFLDEIKPILDAESVSIEDIDGNVSWDIIVGGSEEISLVFSQTADAGAWQVDEVIQASHRGTGMLVSDFNNDSWMDLLVNTDEGIELCRLGPWGFSNWMPVEVDLEEKINADSAWCSADFDRDGSIDFMGHPEESLVVLLNKSLNSGHHLDVRFKGIDDNASGRVNHYAIGSVLELRFGPHYRSRIVNSPVTHFGLGSNVAAGSLRAILPNGLTQTSRNPQVDSLIEEEQTLKGSCPYLYAWDGEKFVFKTDCLWAAPLGLQVAHGVVAKDRPWEYLKIDGDDIAPRGDHYEFRITEELWEVAYFDEISMSVVDHPQDVEIWTNEKVGPGNIATPTTFAFESRDRHALEQAVDTQGREVTSELAEIDQEFVKAFDYRLRQGLCPPHWIDLNFGSRWLEDKDHSGGSVFLVLTGWIMPTDTSLNIQIDQNPELGPLEFPSIWVPDSTEEGGWRKALPYMGFPGGKTKTIVVDVTDILNPQDPRFRIRTSAQIYWDHAELVSQTEPASFIEQPLTVRDAEVTFHGFSARLREEEKTPETYDYQEVSVTPRWPPLRGELTRRGPCTDLIRKWDDRMVVIGAGDEIVVRFELPNDPIPKGWKRDFIIHSVGWDKDADLNTLAGQSIGPLPFKEMKQYPPAEGGSGSRSIDQLNRDHLSRSQSFRSFWYRQESATSSPVQ